jgi:actin-related protein 6
VFPNCTAKPKGGRQVYVGDQLLDSRDISQLALRRPIDRVRAPSLPQRAPTS